MQHSGQFQCCDVYILCRRFLRTVDLVHIQFVVYCGIVNIVNNIEGTWVIILLGGCDRTSPWDMSTLPLKSRLQSLLFLALFGE